MYKNISDSLFIPHLLKTRLIIAVCVFIFVRGVVFGQGGNRFYNELSGTLVLPGNSFMVTDDRFHDESWLQISKTQAVSGYVALEINDESRVITKEGFVCQIRVRIDQWDSRGDSTATEQDLIISFDPSGKAVYDARSEIHFSGYHEFRVTILDLKSNSSETDSKFIIIPPILRLKGYLEVNRTLEFDCQEMSVITSGYNAGNARMVMNWSSITEADEYEVEWTFYEIDSEWGQYYNSPNLIVNFDDIFKNNATRLVTPFQEFELPLVYSEGYIFYRVRGANVTSDGLRQTTNWSYVAANAPLSTFDGVFEVSFSSGHLPHEPSLNWQTDNVFAEEGRSSQSVVYADGNSRTRQNVTLSRADNIVIAQQPVYDFHGRPAVQVMPAPVFGKFGQYSSVLGFVRNFAQNTSGLPYNASNFDVGNDCNNFIIDPMSQNTGASRYYSSFNISANDPLTLHRFIPDAQGFPFSVTEYTPDATGRIKRRGNVGPAFRNDGTHNGSFYYTTASQSELNRIFKPDDVGVDEHYQKNIIKDPNGQYLVKYFDASGRTIATALAGPPPDNLQPLEQEVAPENIAVNLLKNVVRDATKVSTYMLQVYEPGGQFEFNYTMDGLNYGEDCMGICYDCMYDLSIRVVDNCGNPNAVYESNKTNVNLPGAVNPCSPVNSPGLDDTFIITLEPGEYTVSKTLSVSQDAVEYYAEQYLNTPCIPELEDLEEDFTATIIAECATLNCGDCIRVAEGFINSDPELYQILLNECKLQCKGDTIPNHCEIYYNTLLADVSLGGQYMTLYTDPNDPDKKEICSTPVEDPTSMFFTDINNPMTPAYRFPESPYLDEDGNEDIIVIQGVEFRPEELDVCDFIYYWKHSWAKSLIKKHPEYCLYQLCTEQYPSENYNTMLWGRSTFPNTTTLGTGVLNADPYFTGTGGGVIHYNEMLDFINNFTTDNSGNPHSLVDVIISHIACNDELPVCVNFSGLCSSDKITVWRMFLSAYMGYKYGIFSKDINGSNCNLTECIEVDIPCSGFGANYADKTKRWRVHQYAEPGMTGQDLQNLLDDYLANEITPGIAASCQENCEGNVDAWIAKLLAIGCVSLTVDHVAALKPLLLAICMEGCDDEHPYGFTNVPTGSGLMPGSIREALIAVTGFNIDDCNEDCNDLFVGFPGTFENPLYFGGQSGPFLIDGTQEQPDCTCDNLKKFQDCFFGSQPPAGYTTFLDYVNSFSDIKLTAVQLSDLIYYCDELTCDPLETLTFAERVISAPQFVCNVCKTNLEVNEVYKLSLEVCNNMSDALRAAYMNHHLGLNLEWEDYWNFISTYNSLSIECRAAAVLCPRSFVTPQDAYNCVDELTEIYTSAALDAYNAEVAALVAEFKTKYLTHCISAIESFTTNAGLNEQQYTLYYYDRSGKLVQTVPPEGVVINNPAAHKLVTTYRYDCFGNAVARITPDGGLTQSWYDRLGRAVVTQDKRQFNASPKLYSYTIYDGLSRPIETGEKTETVMGGMTNVIARDQSLLTAWLEENAASARKDITRTYYDRSPIDWPTIHTPNVQPSMVGFMPENVRKRIAANIFMPVYHPPLQPGEFLQPGDYDYATHYSYDINGSAKTLVQDIRELSSSGTNRYKRIDYNYDIGSGKVNQVDYQNGAIDHFVYKYTYDMNNRLLLTETSTTGAVGSWERDAEYEYYYHGPLGRKVLGHRNVQGVDYAYTLQGWIKGVNASAMDAFTDDSEIPEYLYIHDEDIPSGVYRARTAIISHGRVREGRNVEFRAGKYITLEQGGFRADLGCIFLAIIDPALITNDPGDIVDMGRDGAIPDGRPDVARDAYSYTVGYYNNDYTKISNNSTPDFEISKNYNGFYTDAPQLYNGNIRHIAQQAKTLTASAFNYQYDQLNRLVSMDYWRRPDGLQWGTTDAYHEEVTYDRNGNILTYLRNAGNVNGNMIPLDNLVYHYLPLTNTLDFVEELAPQTPNIEGDIEPLQATANYLYNGSGSLISDASDPMHTKTFEWSMYGKLRFVHGLADGEEINYGYDALQRRVKKSFRDFFITEDEPPLSGHLVKNTFYIRDGQGNTLATYEQVNNTLTLKELELYGSGRLGVFRANKLMFINGLGNVGSPIGTSYMGKKEYELINHLGNVIASVRDESDPVDIDNDFLSDYFEPRVISAREFYPFGLPMPNRKSPSYVNTGYRYGFNGKESDDEAGYGDDGFQDYGMRMYMPALARFFTVDPIADVYPWYTPYQFAGNTPIWAVDLDGLEPEYKNGDKRTGASGSVYVFQDGAWFGEELLKEAVIVGQTPDWIKAGGGAEGFNQLRQYIYDKKIDAQLSSPYFKSYWGVTPEFSAKAWQDAQYLAAMTLKEAWFEDLEAKEHPWADGWWIFGESYASGRVKLKYGTTVTEHFEGYVNLGLAASDITLVKSLGKLGIKGVIKISQKAEPLLYRRGASNVGKFSDLQVPMNLRTVDKIAEQAGVGLKKVKIKIDRNPDMIGKGFYGHAQKGKITLYPDAFTDVETLVKTLGHERTHVFQIKLYGMPKSSSGFIFGEMEEAAYKLEGDFWDFYLLNK